MAKKVIEGYVDSKIKIMSWDNDYCFLGGTAIFKKASKLFSKKIKITIEEIKT